MARILRFAEFAKTRCGFFFEFFELFEFETAVVPVVLVLVLVLVVAVVRLELVVVVVALAPRPPPMDAAARLERMHSPQVPLVPFAHWSSSSPQSTQNPRGAGSMRNPRGAPRDTSDCCDILEFLSEVGTSDAVTRRAAMRVTRRDDRTDRSLLWPLEHCTAAAAPWARGRCVQDKRKTRVPCANIFCR